MRGLRLVLLALLPLLLGGCAEFVDSDQSPAVPLAAASP